MWTRPLDQVNTGLLTQQPEGYLHNINLGTYLLKTLQYFAIPFREKPKAIKQPIKPSICLPTSFFHFSRLSCYFPPGSLVFNPACPLCSSTHTPSPGTLSGAPDLHMADSLTFSRCLLRCHLSVGYAEQILLSPPTILSNSITFLYFFCPYTSLSDISYNWPIYCLVFISVCENIMFTWAGMFFCF